MAPAEAKGDVVLRLLDGRSERREIILAEGCPVPPFAIGTQGAWRVDSVSVAPAHVIVAFNGSAVFVCAVGDELALLDGATLKAQWTEAKMPSELRLGGARVTISRRNAASRTPSRTGEATRAIERSVPAAAPRRSASNEATALVPAPPRERRDGRPVNYDMTVIVDRKLLASAIASSRAVGRADAPRRRSAVAPEAFPKRSATLALPFDLCAGDGR